MRPVVVVLLVAFANVGCRNDRPPECQALRQCCAAAGASGSEIETVRVACTRADDNDPVLCRRRLDDVVAAVPGMSDRPECRVPAAP